MPNEITAEELARKVYSPLGNDYDGQIPSYWADAAETFLSLTRAHATLMAERQAPRTFDKTEERDFATAPKPEPEKVRCWLIEGHGLTMARNKAKEFEDKGVRVAKGWFTPDTKGEAE